MNLQELYALLNTQLTQARTLAEQAATSEAGLTEEVEAQIEALRNDAKETEAKIARAQRAQTLADELRTQQAALTAPADRRSAPMQPDFQGQVPALGFDELRSYGSIPNFKRAYDGVPMLKVKEAAYRTGMWLVANFWNNPRAAAWCKDNGVGMRESRDLTGASGDGAKIVPDEMSNVLIVIREAIGVFRRVIGRVWPMASDTLIVPTRAGGLTVYFPAQSAAITGSDLAFGQASLGAIKMAAMSKFPTELAEDAVLDIAELVSSELGYALAGAEDLCGFIGDGSGTYGTITGIVPAVTGVSSNKSTLQAATGHDTVAELDAADLRKCLVALPGYAGIVPKWYCSKGVADEVFGRLTYGAGGNTAADLAAGRPARYAGYDIETTEALAKTDASAGSAVIVFGDIGMGVAMGNRRDISVSLSDQRYWTEDQIALKATERLAMTVHTPGTSTKAGPLTVLKLAAS